MELINFIGPMLSIFLIICVLSFLYQDNPFYKFAEHLYLGVSAGYFLIMTLSSTIMPNFVEPLIGKNEKIELYSLEWFLLIFPLVLGLMMFAGYSKRFNWLVAIPISYIIGTYAGFNIIGFATGDLIIQLRANMLPVVVNAADGSISLLDSINNILIIIGVICSLFYFFFSREHTGALGYASKIGIWFLMVSFGASFGFTVMGRISLAVGRAQELLQYKAYTVVSILIIIGGLMVISYLRRDDEEEGA
ncbi:MAG: hypothetical protein Kow0090_05290 [Myxococcota bacterium]